MNIVLIGMKSSGKTRVGKALSLMLNRNFLDTDEILKSLFFKKFQKKKNIFEIFQKFLKEEKFRILEHDAFCYLKNIKNSIIATGGGSVLNEKNYKILKNSKIIVYLKASIDTLKKRIQKQKQNSIFLDEKLLEKAFESREGIYENIADITIQTDNNDIEKIAFEIKNETKYLYV
ncbi:MAG: Shikimate kinase 2 [Candidatus Anoxychlamydiales bacterium]|nr:Shikimate kinase 2 [Candidatus Anoxychlamydiales bacterium]